MAACRVLTVDHFVAGTAKEGYGFPGRGDREDVIKDAVVDVHPDSLGTVHVQPSQRPERARDRGDGSEDPGVSEP